MGRILTLPPFGVPRLRGFLERGRPDRLKAGLRTGQGLGLRRGQCQDAPEIMRADHHSARFQISPNPGMASRLSQFKGLHENRPKNLLHVLLASCLPSSIDCSLHAVQEFRSSDGGNNRLAAGKLPEKAGQIKFSTFVCDQNRTVQDQSHASLTGGRLAWARSMSSAKALASSGASLSKWGHRSASSAQVSA